LNNRRELLNLNIYNNNGKEGFQFETMFGEKAKEYGLSVERFDKYNLRNPDYKIENYLFDPKIKNTVFEKAMQYTGIEPLKCVVIDIPKINSYLSAYRETKIPMFIVIKLKYTYKENTDNNIYTISIKKVEELMFMYPHRIMSFKDHQKNDRFIERFYISTDEMRKTTLEEIFKNIQ
jgi:hypothetical protein